MTTPTGSIASTAKPVETLEARLDALHTSFNTLREVRSSVIANKQLLPSDHTKYLAALDVCIDGLKTTVNDSLFYTFIDVADYLYSTKEARAIDAIQLLLIDPSGRSKEFARFMDAAHSLTLALTGPFLIGRTDFHHAIQLAKRLSRESTIEKTITPYTPVSEPAKRGALGKLFGSYAPSHADGFTAVCESPRKVERAIELAQEQGYACLRVDHPHRDALSFSEELQQWFEVDIGSSYSRISFDGWNNARKTVMNYYAEVLEITDLQSAKVATRHTARSREVFPYGNGSQIVVKSAHPVPSVTMVNSLLPESVVRERIENVAFETVNPESLRDTLEAVYVRTRSFPETGMIDAVATWALPATKK